MPAPVCQTDFRGGDNSHITSTFSSRHAPLYACDVTSSSSALDAAALVNDYDDDDHDCATNHQFGTKPTRASTSIGTLPTMHRVHIVYRP